MLLLWWKNFDERIKNVKVIYMDIGDLFYHRQFLDLYNIPGLYSEWVVYPSHTNLIVNGLWSTRYGNGIVLYKVHSIPMSSTTVTRQLLGLWDFSGGNILCWYGVEPYRCHFVKYGECMGFCQIRSNSIVKGHRSYGIGMGLSRMNPIP